MVSNTLPPSICRSAYSPSISLPAIDDDEGDEEYDVNIDENWLLRLPLKRQGRADGDHPLTLRWDMVCAKTRYLFSVDNPRTVEITRLKSTSHNGALYKGKYENLGRDSKEIP